jgi:hypothetical protein
MRRAESHADAIPSARALCREAGLAPLLPFDFWIKKQRTALSHLTEAETQMIRDHTFERRETTPAQREARKAFREVIPGNAMTDYAKAQKSLHENRERLKAERLAREAKARARPSSD